MDTSNWQMILIAILFLLSGFSIGRAVTENSVTNIIQIKEESIFDCSNGVDKLSDDGFQLCYKDKLYVLEEAWNITTAKELSTESTEGAKE